MTFNAGADLNQVLADLKGLGLGVQVTYNGVTVNGVRDDRDELGQGYEGLATVQREQSVLITSGSVGGLANDTEITVGGTVYQIRRFDREPPDGVLTRITLAAE